MKKIFLIIVLVILLGYVSMIMFVNSNKKAFQIPVLMYHNILPDEYYEGQADTISVSAFEEQLKYFQDNNYKTLTLDEFYDWLVNGQEIPVKSVLLTFDDGFYSFHYLAEPLLEKYDMHAACFVIGSATNENTSLYDPLKYGTIGKDLINNHSSYVEYGSHSFGLHKEVNGKKIIKTLSINDLREDVKKMQDIYDFKYMTYPFNTDTDDLIKVLKENNYKLAFRGEAEMVSRKANRYQIPRIGAQNDFSKFQNIMESNEFKNRYGYGLVRKVMITIERKLGKRLF